jgi:uncharacterized protein YhbP (UPF0306 family)
MKLVNIATRSAAGTRIRSSVSSRALSASVFQILEDTCLCSTATVDDAHRAHINIAYFAYAPDLSLCFLSHPASRHCVNLSSNPSMAVTVFSSAQRWGYGDCGVQLFGACSVARNRRIKAAANLYAKRFPAYGTWRQSIASEEIGREYRFYRFLPRSLSLLDERRFGDGVIVTARVTR